MKPFTVNGCVWRVVSVPPSDPHLVDRTGTRTLGTTDPITRTIHVSGDLRPPQLDMVVLHEVAHAVTISYGLLEALHEHVPERYWVWVEEWACHIVETYGNETASLASFVLGRPACASGFCHD